MADKKKYTIPFGLYIITGVASAMLLGLFFDQNLALSMIFGGAAGVLLGAIMIGQRKSGSAKTN